MSFWMSKQFPMSLYITFPGLTPSRSIFYHVLQIPANTYEPEPLGPLVHNLLSIAETVIFHLHPE